MRCKPLSSLVAGLLLALVGSVVPAAATAQSASTVALAAAPASEAAASTTGFVAQPVVWGRCKNAYLRATHLECGLLTVPLDPADPTGPTIQVGVSRLLHSKGPYRGAVFTNAGGPGGSGLFLASYGKLVPDKVGLRYDWYGFDPRGIGTSVPRVSCDKTYFNRGDRPDYHPTSKRDLRFWRHKTKAYAADCATSASAPILAHDTTADTVADYEVLRESIGADQVTWYGASYGTYVGEVYATLHPDRLKAMVLDGVIGPAGAWYQANLDQNIAFQKPFEAFLAWMGRYPGVYHVGTGAAEVERTYHRLRRQLARQPAANGTFGPDELDDSLLPAAYYNVTWTVEAQAFSALVNDANPKPLVKAWRGGSPRNDDNANAGYLATECTDAPWPTHWSTWASDARRTYRKAPYDSWLNTWFNAPCRTWPFAASPQIQVDGSGYTGPVLMTEQSLDPATPYAGALAARALFPTSRIVVGVGGTSHAVSLYGVACNDDAIADVLRDGTLPARRPGNRPDVKCPPLKPVDPRPRDASAGAAQSAPAAVSAATRARGLLPFWLATIS